MVRISPSTLRVERGGRRTVRARSLDATGRPVDVEVEYRWSLSDSAGSLRECVDQPDQVTIEAGDAEALATLSVIARASDHEAQSDIVVEILDRLLVDRGDKGIPEPAMAEMPQALWRSRMQAGRWEVNSGHRDYLAVADRPALKLRYLSMLFAKEVVLRHHHDSSLEKPLEQMIEIASYADLKLSKPGPKRKG